MTRFVLGRLAQAIVVLFVIITGCFFMMKLAPGGPFDSEKKVPEEIRKQLEAHYRLDRPLFQQYTDYLAGLARGDLGPSFKYSNRSVNEIIGGAFPVSMELGAYALLVALVIGLGAGVLAALRPNTLTDYVPMSFAMVGISLPTFVFGPLLVLAFAIHWRIFNASGWDSARDRVLPALTLGIYYAAYIARLARGGMLEILNQDFIRTARAKGASPWRIVIKHALRGGLLPVVSYLAPTVAGLMTGSFVVETIFQIPGLGRHFVTATFNRDYTLILGTALFLAAFILTMNFLADIALAWLNPKVRFD